VRFRAQQHTKGDVTLEPFAALASRQGYPAEVRGSLAAFLTIGRSCGRERRIISLDSGLVFGHFFLWWNQSPDLPNTFCAIERVARNSEKDKDLRSRKEKNSDEGSQNYDSSLRRSKDILTARRVRVMPWRLCHAIEQTGASLS